MVQSLAAKRWSGRPIPCKVSQRKGDRNKPAGESAMSVLVAVAIGVYVVWLTEFIRALYEAPLLDGPEYS